MKRKVIEEGLFSACNVYLSNINDVIIISSYSELGQDALMDLKKVFDYMSSHDESLAFGVHPESYCQKVSRARIDSIIEYVSSCSFRDAFILPQKSYLQTGYISVSDPNDFIIMKFGAFDLSMMGSSTPPSCEYSANCKKNGLADISLLRDRNKIRREDVDLYYDYLMAHDMWILGCMEHFSCELIDVNYDHFDSGSSVTYHTIDYID